MYCLKRLSKSLSFTFVISKPITHIDTMPQYFNTLNVRNYEPSTTFSRICFPSTL